MLKAFLHTNFNIPACPLCYCYTHTKSAFIHRLTTLFHSQWRIKCAYMRCLEWLCVSIGWNRRNLILMVCYIEIWYFFLLENINFHCQTQEVFFFRVIQIRLIGLCRLCRLNLVINLLNLFLKKFYDSLIFINEIKWLII